MNQLAKKISTGHYGFGGRLTEDFPSQIIVDITEVCNLACVHCPHPDFKQSEHYDARYLTPELNAKLVDEVAQYGKGKTQYIRYTSNGEPLVHPKAYDMIEYAVKNSGVFVTLTTNGTIMNEKRTRRLLEAGIHLIDISIDAINPETYAKVRVGGDLAVTNSNVMRLLEWVNDSGLDTKVVVSYVEQPLNKAETNDFETFWKSRGVDYVVIRRLHTHSGAKAGENDVRRKQAEKLERRPCLYPWERISLNAAGELSFCPSDWVHGSKLADYRDTSVCELWQSDTYKKLRAAHLNNDFTMHHFCGQCPDWKETRWPEEGRSYADMVAEMKDEE